MMLTLTIKMLKQIQYPKVHHSQMGQIKQMQLMRRRELMKKFPLNKLIKQVPILKKKRQTTGRMITIHQIFRKTIHWGRRLQKMTMQRNREPIKKHQKQIMPTIHLFKTMQGRVTKHIHMHETSTSIGKKRCMLHPLRVIYQQMMMAVYHPTLRQTKVFVNQQIKQTQIMMQRCMIQHLRLQRQHTIKIRMMHKKRTTLREESKKIRMPRCIRQHKTLKRELRNKKRIPKIRKMRCLRHHTHRKKLIKQMHKKHLQIR